MAHHNTVFAQWLKFVPGHEFESLANQHHAGRKLRKMTRFNGQIVTAFWMGSVTSRLRPESSTAVCEPIKPSPPVTRIFCIVR